MPHAGLKSLARSVTLGETIARIRRVTPGSVRLWGKMSPDQMMRHCTDAFHIALGEKKVAPVNKPLAHSLLKWFVLYAPVHWPKNVPTEKPMDADSTEKPAGNFSDDVAELERICHRFVLTKKRDAMLEHPFFGPLSDTEWLRWGYLHLDHHLRQFGV